MACPRRSSWTLVLLLAPALAAQAAPAGGGTDAPALFASNCAKCHGLDGSGTGPAVLDRPARNFKEGGFSFGNTPETIARTIAFGIPGSPMPAFEHAMSDEQRRALADYVVTLGPPVKEVSESETLMHVTDRPLVVRGILPPLSEGAHNIPRGLLIGTPDGLTFEYSVDDVRLLAVREGDFVRRTDWGGRGGTPLEPLGQVVWSAPESAGTWSFQRWEETGGLTNPRPASARLLSTSALGEPSVTYALVANDEAHEPIQLLATVVETVGPATLGGFSGFRRSFRVERHAHCRLALDQKTSADLFPMEPVSRDSISGGVSASGWWSHRIDAEVGEVIRVVTSDERISSGFDEIEITESTNRSVVFSVDVFVVSPWTEDMLAKFRELVAR
ncbi:MAG TPA: cytochrome c [Planctomycetota bacterium]|nr:cytochrome c [Planctomycetota bacterium]